MKLCKKSKGLLGSLCRGQQTSGEKVLTLEYVDRAALSGLFVLHGIMETLIDDNDNCREFTLGHWLSFVEPLVGMDHALAIKRLKYVTSLWFAKFLHDQAPEKDDPAWDGWLFSGAVKRYLRTRLVSHSAKNARLFYSLLQAKRACDPVPESFVQGALEKHRKIIGSKSAPLTAGQRASIRRCTREIVSSWDSFEDSQFEPSHSACWELSRKNGGQARALMKALGDWCPTKDLVSVCEGFKQLDGTLLSDDFAKVLKAVTEPLPNDLVGMVETTPGQISERRGWLEPSRSAMLYAAYAHEHGLAPIQIPGENIVVVKDDDELGLRTEDSWRWCYTRAIKPAGQMTAGVSAVLEPLKVRTVTKGRALAYNAVHGVQKWMHSNLRSHRIFQLIGHTVDEQVIKDDLFRFRKPGEFLISGDYSAATDNLKIEVTKTIFEVVLEKLASDLDYSVEAEKIVELARKVLYEHEIHYSLESGLQPVLQGTGQLMGSTLSFPILCLANCICCWLSLFGAYEFNDLPMLVNGDDIGFCCSKERYDRWSQDLAGFGFVKSVGKNYCSDRFFIINSELFDSRYVQTGKCHIPYFKSGLLLGRHKVQSVKGIDEDESPDAPIISTLDLVLESALNKERALGRFVTYNRTSLEEVTQKRYNLFLPRENGGLGLKSYGIPFHVGLWQRRYATYLHQQEVLKLPSYRRVARGESPWLTVHRVKCDPWQVDDSLSLKEKLNALAKNFQRCDKEKLHELSRNGPKGWCVQDTEGRTEWNGRLSGSRLRAIGHCKPCNKDLTAQQVHYRYAISVPRINLVPGSAVCEPTLEP
jgi:hypothetical protein